MSRLPRRLITIPGIWIGFAACLAAAPLWLPLLALSDAVRRRRLAGLRIGATLTWLLGCEVAGTAGCGALWLWHAGGRRDPAGWARRNFALQCAWTGGIFGGAARIFGMRLSIEPGGEPPARGPLLVLPRHASIADTLLPALLFSIPHGTRLRYVLKRELLWEPCVDLVGHRLPNAFVDRDAADAKPEIAAVADLARGLGPGDGVLIYPEGTRFSPAKQRRARARLRERGDPLLAARAASLRHLLPPRPGGTLALLDRFAARGAGQVVVVAHTGFEGSARLADLWAGRLIGAEIRVRCFTTPAAALPADRLRWLLDAWTAVDDWLDDAAGSGVG